MRLNKVGGLAWVFAVVALFFSYARPACGYSVLAHEAIIDRAWEDSIKPVLLQRFPGTTADQLLEARAYAYGGCAIQDLGYYPFSSRYFSDLTHYVRSGDFVAALIRDASGVDEYSFALGALSHYAADSAGHSIAINKSVPMEYPKLRARYGNDVTYEDNPSAHMQAEFGFDVIQIASGRYVSNSYHRFIGFRISRRLLERAFFETYGIKLSSALASVDLAFVSYTTGVGSVIPEMTMVAWEMKRDSLVKPFPETTSALGFGVVRPEPRWPGRYRGPGPFARTAAIWFQIVPPIGPLKPLRFREPPPAAESLFIQSLNVTLDGYRQLLTQVAEGSLQLKDTNLDTGRLARSGEYRLADQAYARLLNDLTKNGFCGLTAQLKENIVTFYGQSEPVQARSRTASRGTTREEFERLRNSPPHISGSD